MAKPSYISCTPTSGSNNGTVKVTCTSGYKGRSQRSGNITIGSKSVGVTQFGAPLYVRITSTPTIVSKNGSEVLIQGYTNGKIITLAVENAPEFYITSLKYQTQNGTGSNSSKTITPNNDPGADGEIYFTAIIDVPENLTTSIISARVIATVQGDTSAQTASANLILTQESGDATLNVSPTNLYFTADGVPCDANGDEISGATQTDGQVINVVSNTAWEVS